MNNLLSIKFWFNIRPIPLLPVYQKALIAFVVCLAILTFVFFFLGKGSKGLYKKTWRALGNLCLSNAIIGLMILFFSTEMIPLLSARFWFIVWGAEMATWLFITARAAREIPKRKKEIEKEREFKKYIP